MAETPPHGIPMVEENEAAPEVAAMYAEIKRDMQSPTVPNYLKALAVSPEVLAVQMALQRSYYENLTLPRSLISMICFAIAERNNCKYCSSLHELSCRTLGVDDATLASLAESLEDINPERIRAIIQFATKVASNPQSLRPADYDRVRSQGVSNSEILEIIYVAGVAAFYDILADTLQIPVDDSVVEALPNRG